MASAPRDGNPARQQPLVVVAEILCIMILMHASGVQAKSSLTIKNLASSDVLVHCLSGDDLGLHDLYSQQQISWAFHRNFWGSTKFFCYFELTNNGQLMKQGFTAWVDGIVAKDVVCNQCLWNVNDTGFSVYNPETQSFAHVYDWIPDPPESHL